MGNASLSNGRTSTTCVAWFEHSKGGGSFDGSCHGMGRDATLVTVRALVHGHRPASRRCLKTSRLRWPLSVRGQSALPETVKASGPLFNFGRKSSERHPGMLTARGAGSYGSCPGWHGIPYAMQKGGPSDAVRVPCEYVDAGTIERTFSGHASGHVKQWSCVKLRPKVDSSSSK